MKKWIMLGICLWTVQTLPGAAAPLRVVTLEQPPLEYKEQGEIKGIAVDLVKKIFIRMQQAITLELYPFARSLDLMAKGKADALFAIVKKPERERFMRYPTEVLINQTATLFTRKDARIQFDGDFRPLSGYRFGILRAATYGPQYDEAVKNGTIRKIEMARDYRQNMLKLVNDRLDIIIGPRLSLLYAIKQLGHREAIRELSPSIEIVPTYIAFSKTRIAPAIIARVSQILKELKRDGTYDRIVQAYIQ